MADISKITLPDNTTYNIKDKNARNFTNTPYYEQDEEALMFQLGESYMTGEQDNQPYSFRAAGGSADIGNREYDKIIGGTMAWNQLVRDEASTNEVDFADIVTVDDAVEDAAAVKVKIEPVQDLHGYDHPWPAGDGKNKCHIDDFSVTINGVTISSYDNKLTISGITTSLISAAAVLWRNIKFTVSEEAEYKLSVTSVFPSGISFAFYDADNVLHTINSTLFVGEYTVGIYIPNGITFDNFSTQFQVEKGSTATEWAPYSNICPITGWTGAKVTRTGKNLFRAVDGSYQGSNTNTTFMCSNGVFTLANNTQYPLGVTELISEDRMALILGEQRYLKPGTYAFNADIINLIGTTSVANIRLMLKDDITGNERYVLNGSSVTIANPCTTTRIICSLTGGYPVGASISFTCQLELGSIASDYEPYVGNTYSITFPTEAGTVYGGELTVSADGSGSLVVDRAYYDGSTWTQYNTSNGYKAYKSNTLPRAKSNDDISNNPISNTIGVFGSFSSSNMTQNIILPPRSRSEIAYMSLKDDLDPTGIDLSYLIATPVTYSFTAAQIRTLLGENNVWTDTGDLALTYTGTDEHLTLESGRKYLAYISGTDSMLLGSGQEITAEKGTNNVFDLTQMFGTTIADYIYSLEQTTPGAGVAWFRKLFPKPYYEYNAGELMSVQAVAHKIVGFNAWDEEWELGIINTTTGEETDSNSNIRSKNYIHVIPGATYYFKLGTTDISNNVVFYDAEKNYVAASDGHTNDTFTVPEDAHYMKFYMSTNYGSTYLSNICINLSGNGERDGEYEEYKMHSYPLDSSLTLRGIPKLDENNQLYYDGDTYEADGTVTRKYGIVDLGTLYWYKVTTNNINVFQTEYIYDAKNWANVINIICSFYKSAPNKINATAALNNGDKTVCLVLGKYPYVQINDSSKENMTVAEFKTAMSGVYIVYELATPTTETAEPYDNPQIVAPEGTEEYITTNIVFVGHETKY